MRPTGSNACRHKTDNSPTTCQDAMSLRSTGLEVIEWGGTWSEDDDGDVRGCGARLGLHCRVALGLMCVRMVGGHVRVVGASWDGSG